MTIALPTTAILRAFSKEGVSFLTKVVGPVAEVSELLSDKVRFYRWRAAIRTISRASQIAEEKGLEPNQIPLKFLVPFLEDCSLEEDASELTELWARLLVAASQGAKAEHFIFLDILKKMSPGAAKIFQEFPVPTWGEAETYFSLLGGHAPAIPAKYFDGLHRIIIAQMRKGAAPTEIVEAISNRFQEQCRKRGCVLGHVDAALALGKRKVIDDARFGGAIVESLNEFALLKHLDLIASIEHHSPVLIVGKNGTEQEAGHWLFRWVQLTGLGAKLRKTLSQPGTL